MHATPGSRVEDFHTLKVSPAINTQDQTRPATSAAHAAAHAAKHSDNTALDGHSGVSLLSAVDFKWLMTGHGWWVDSARLSTDPSYAATLLGLAMASPSAALRDCAARLQAQMTQMAQAKAG